MAIEIVDFPIKNGWISNSYVSLPEGNMKNRFMFEKSPPTSQPRPQQLLRQLGHVWRMAVLDETLQDAAGVPQRCKRKPGPLEMAI